jgi:hypothetical protein
VGVCSVKGHETNLSKILNIMQAIVYVVIFLIIDGTCVFQENLNEGK